MTSEELIEKFLRLEEENHFFNLKISNYKFWHYIRFDVYTTLMENYGLFNKNVSVDGKLNKKVDFLELLKRVMVKNQFFLCKKDILIFSNPRMVKEGDYYKCLYTDLISKNLENSYYIFDNSYNDEFYFPRNVSNVKNSNPYSYMAAFSPNDKVPFEGRMLEERIYSVIEKNFERPLSVKQKIKINSTLINFLNERDGLRDYYQYILKRIKPKVIIIVCYYSFKMMVLCETAKEMNIPVVELQHGTMGKEHISYNFLRRRNLSTFPDYVFTFSRFDKENTRFPIAPEKIYAVGYPEMEKKVRSYEKLRLKTKKKKKILFISQSIKAIFEYAVELSKRIDLNEFEIIIKLHPREFGNWRKEFGKMLNGANVTIIDNSDKDIYYYLARADYVVGIFSTVLLEATMFNTNIVVIKEASYTYMKELYQNDMAVLVDSVDELQRIVTNNIQTSNCTKAYFERNSIVKIKSAIKEIIRKGGK